MLNQMWHTYVTITSQHGPLLQVGQRAEGCTGADLSALLSEAQLAAVHERLDEQGSATQVNSCTLPA